MFSALSDGMDKSRKGVHLDASNDTSTTKDVAKNRGMDGLNNDPSRCFFFIQVLEIIYCKVKILEGLCKI